MNDVAVTSSGAFVRASDVEMENLDPGIRRQILGYGPDLMIARIWFETDAVGAAHKHFHSQSSYIESGRFRVRVGDNEQELGPGDSYYIEPHVVHGSVCLEAGVVIDTFSPVREDFLATSEGYSS